MLSKTKAVNYALILLLLSWPLVLLLGAGVMFDYKHEVPTVTVKLTRLVSVLGGVLGVFGLTAALALAGYGFPAAKLRASLAIAGVLAPIVRLFTL